MCQTIDGKSVVTRQEDDWGLSHPASDVLTIVRSIMVLCVVVGV